MMSQAFFEQLEWALSDTLLQSARPELRSYWCDGVLGPEWESDYLPVYVAQSHQVVLRAWLERSRTKGQGPTQHLYQLVIHLGSHSYRQYLDERELQVPKRLDSNSIVLDIEKQVIEIQLP